MHLIALVLSVLVLVAAPALGADFLTLSQAGETPDKYKPAIQKGLAWLVKQQNKDGSWPARDSQSDVASSAMAGLALLMEGSTPAKGKYADNIKNASDWLVRNCQTGDDDGLFGRRDRLDRTGYMLGQGYAVLFLASAYAREDKADAKDFSARLARARQREVEDVLKRAVQFAAKAQAQSGGWCLTACKEAQDLEDVGSTLVQILALRAAQQAGFEIPKDTLTKAFAFLEKLTTPQGGIPFSSRNAGKSGSERPGLTIAAFASTFGAEQLKADLAKKWFKYAESTVTTRESYALFHYALALHALDDQGYAKLFDKKNPAIVWSKTRKKIFDEYTTSQSRDGSWTLRDWNPNPTFGAAIGLIVLQLDNDGVPIWRAKKE